MTDPRRVPREPAAFEGEERRRKGRGRKGRERDAPRKGIRNEGIHL